ncbi:MAG: TetR/AcrR family transcriptional regulator [Clostridiales bacterium]|uniref:TetR/AcrR family transcriptional regulator n=1 Tax=Clostridium sp. N3C TaxID=1776758 RepID=UPI00092E0C69|nr:TetR/AcrR family transcriptional regulator [Clostridium sp. N3C]NLZ47175.1 TetR/AcrR family transcriptional regulator [Clostridiales bacterium]SCN23599.1 HTH-type transcriptional regulator MtrR [Clostridium sp. N3C]
MPTETFLNLPIEKKNKLIMAIKREFARVPYDKVSINKIVQDADISRGSFYMYFNDKEDMLKFILSNYYHELIATIKKSSKENKGDLFDVFRDIFRFTADFGMEEDNIAFCINIFTSDKVHNCIIAALISKDMKDKPFNWISPYIDTSNLNINCDEDLYNIIEILIAVTQKAVIEVFLHIDNKDKVLENYEKKIKILKGGMVKR